jgi:hypothetical protein
MFYLLADGEMEGPFPRKPLFLWAKDLQINVVRTYGTLWDK